MIPFLLIADIRSNNRRVLQRHPIVIRAARHGGEPRGIVEIPGYAATNPRGERFGRRPAELLARPRSVDGVTPIVAGAVANERDLPHEVATGAALREHRADRAHHLDVLHFGVAADVIDGAGATALEHGSKRRAVIADVEPVTHILAIAIDGQRLAGERIDD